MNTMAKVLAMVGLGMVAATVAGEARAQSFCGMGDVDWYKQERENVARADELLAQGKAQDAAWLVQQTWPRMNEAVPVASSLPQIAEGVRVMALATVRTDGDVKTGLGWAARTPLERAVNVQWGVSRLRMLVAANAESDAAKTDLGEALARAPETREEARGILETLAAKNAIATPEGYAALARVRSEAGDANGSAIAMSACRAHAGDATNRCAMPTEVHPFVVASR